MTPDECECLGYGTDDAGRFVCIDCGDVLFPGAEPLDAATLEIGRQAQREHDAALSLNPFYRR